MVPAVPDLVALLAISDYLIMPVIHQQIKQHVTSLPLSMIAPSTRVTLSRYINDPEWLRTAYRHIVMGNITSLTAEDFMSLGYDTLVLLIKVSFALLKHRFTVAYRAPHPQHGNAIECPSARRANCEAEWVLWWSTHIAPKLIKTVPPWTGADIVRYLEDPNTEKPDMQSRACATKTMEAAASTKVVLADHDFIEKALDELVELGGW